MRQALMERRGVLVHTKADRGSADLLVTVLAAPILAGDAALGVVGVRTETRPGQRRQADLEFLEILAQSFGPFLHAVEHQEQLRRDNERLRARAGESNTLVGNSPAIQEVVAKIAKVAPTDLNVLITGETGTGKELAARMVHNCSRRRSNPLIVVNCAAIPRELFESELFGYEKGAFTGAQRSTAGLLSRAHGGTLFLDEIGDLSLENQARILRAIEYGTFRPVGGNRERRVDIRVVAATNRHIPAAIEDGEFRTDLFHRLNGFEISLPPLRERRSDIPLLAEHFFTMNRDQAKRPLSGFASEALEALQEYNWPGNVRQLRHTVQRAIAIARDEEIRSDDLGLAQQEAPAGSMDDEPPLPLKEVERNHLQQVLALHNGNVREAARALGIARSTLYKKITEYDLAQQPAR
jgi:DNA-binding NtrC family response regulator